MEMNIDKRFIYKVLVLFLCVYLALMPAFSYKKVHAALSDKFYNFLRISTTLIIGLQSVGFIGDTTLTPENLTNIYNKADEYLHQNFGTELEYAEALRQVDQLGLDIASGQIFVPGNYSGKLWYSFLNAVKDVLWSDSYNVPSNEQFLGVYDSYCFSFYGLNGGEGINIYNDACFPLTTPGWQYDSDGPVLLNRNLFKPGQTAIKGYKRLGYIHLYQSDSLINRADLWAEPGSYSRVVMNFYTGSDPKYLPIYQSFFTGESSNTQYVPNITAKTANKVKLPTRLPPSVINNINNYIDNSTENLIIAPTADELPTLPDNYNPNTDDPPDFPGYEDVTPDQEPTPTPTPTPEPTPEPTTPPDYDGSSWIKPIGDFFAGLLSFLKDALIPTQTVDFSPLQNMGADVSGKFPFSLPGDIGKLFGVLNAEPIRPHFEMDFDLSKVGIPGEPIHWDLNVEQWDNGAAVVKTALYIAFLIGLVFITKQFMQN
ncbi:hypothetical protein [Eubacterium maltosivorans]|uniref:Uncharacterized protein n=1 Tax=Eubacterium maltosivorans TaxID=2041044 RepID=A0A4P9C514_EUBML|nr:hypothetical protein [Eubacterium maltosivorans]QCT70430.1 hypothetical protein CPZ25_003545 [Eubacterium maltosivorans]